MRPGLQERRPLVVPFCVWLLLQQHHWTLEHKPGLQGPEGRLNFPFQALLKIPMKIEKVCQDLIWLKPQDPKYRLSSFKWDDQGRVPPSSMRRKDRRALHRGPGLVPQSESLMVTFWLPEDTELSALILLNLCSCKSQKNTMGFGERGRSCRECPRI